MFKNFGKKLVVAGLNVLKALMYILCAPFAIVMTVFGSYFIAIAFAWCVVLCAAFIVGILFFEASFFMFFVALFNNSLWAIMSNMWSWLWGWFSSGSIALWPHVVKSFPLYIGSGVVFMLIYSGIDHLKSSVKLLKTELQS